MTASIRPQLTHAGLNVFDLPKMRRFYTEVLGLVVSDSGHSDRLDRDFAFLSGEPTKHHQIVLVSGRPAEAKISTVNQLSFKLDTLDELKAMYRRLKEAGITKFRTVTHGNAWSVYCDDPEGNNVELYVDTPWYVAQPHGDPIDLDLPTEEIYRQTEAICRKDPTFMPVAEWQAKMRQRLA